jgi:hypothetical protein
VSSVFLCDMGRRLLAGLGDRLYDSGPPLDQVWGDESPDVDRTSVLSSFVTWRGLLRFRRIKIWITRPRYVDGLCTACGC